jgi:hypothetical protein
MPRSSLEFFSSFLEDQHLVDQEPSKLSPTWRNERKGVNCIAKNLYHFLISEEIIRGSWNIKYWVEVGGLSDHLPILLKLDSK